MRRWTMIVLISMMLIGSATLTSAAPTYSVKELSGVRFTVPAGTPLPSDKVIADAIRKAQPSTRGGAGANALFGVAWFEEVRSWDDHSDWKLGSTFYNSGSSDASQTFKVQGKVQSKFSGSLGSKLVVLSAGFDLSAEISLEVSNTYSVPPHTGRALWGSAWRTNYQGKVHWDAVNNGRWVSGPVSNVSFSIPYAPNFEVTDFCKGCRPPKPSY